MLEMKLEAMTNAAEARILRGQERRAKAKARKQRGNYPFWDELRVGLYEERMQLRREQRYLHLARAFVNGRDYRSVENQTREGNEPNQVELVQTLSFWGYRPDGAYVSAWLEA